MAENSAIQWTTHTFNPWIGCAKVSPGCKHCYAETLMDTRYGRVEWGVHGTRVRTSPGNWRKPLRWNRQAEEAGTRARVFCASLADVFEDRDELEPWREQLFALIHVTPSLDWQLLTKRPENVMEMVGHERMAVLADNLWIGTSVENQEYADLRIPELLKIPAAVRFLSCEPLLGPVDVSAHLRSGRTFHVAADVEGMLRNRHFDGLQRDDGTPLARREAEEELWSLHREGVRVIKAAGTACPGFDHQEGCPGHQQPRVDWVIIGGESGPGARPCNVAGVRSLVEQCQEAGVPAFVKQLGANIRDRNDVGFEADVEVDAETGRPIRPESWPSTAEVEHDPRGFREEYQGAPVRVHLQDRKGGDPSEWPEDLRIRQFPQTTQVTA